MVLPEDRLQDLGFSLPNPQSPVANYVPTVRSGNLLFLCGAGPSEGPDGLIPKGKLGDTFTTEDGYMHARSVGLVQIARLKQELGQLRRVKRIVKLFAMVNCLPDFDEHPIVINGCSDLLVEIFGDAGKHTRSAIGMTSLPFNIPVEIEMVVEITN